MAWHKARCLGLKYISVTERAGSVSATLNFMSLVRAIGAGTTSLLSWSVPQTAPLRGLSLANGGLNCKYCKEAL